MLSKLIHLLEQNPGEYNLQELSGILGVPPSVVSGMLMLLIQKGRIAELGPDCGVCDSCTIRNKCTIQNNQTIKYRFTASNYREAAKAKLSDV